MSYVINAVTSIKLQELLNKAEANIKQSEAYDEKHLEVIKEFRKQLEVEWNEYHK